MLFVIAVILAVSGVFQLIQGDLLWALLLFIAAAAIGPGGWSIARGRRY